MKKILFALSLALLSFTAICQTDTTAVPSPKPLVVTLDTQIVGGQTFYVVADQLDSLLQNVRVVAAPIIQNPPSKPVDWVLLLFKLLGSGVLASLGSQFVKVWKSAKSLFTKLENEWIVLAVSFAVGLGWIYLETKFKDFDFTVLFYRASAVFAIAVVAWRLGLSKILKPKTAKA